MCEAGLPRAERREPQQAKSRIRVGTAPDAPGKAGEHCKKVGRIVADNRLTALAITQAGWTERNLLGPRQHVVGRDRGRFPSRFTPTLLLRELLLILLPLLPGRSLPSF